MGPTSELAHQRKLPPSCGLPGGMDAWSSMCSPTRQTEPRQRKSHEDISRTVSRLRAGPDSSTSLLVALVPLLLSGFLRLLFLRVFLRDFRCRLGQFRDLRSEGAQLSGEVIRTIGS